jgi:predicted ATPase
MRFEVSSSTDGPPARDAANGSIEGLRTKGQLTLREFRVLNFRNIDDSGWIPVDRITTLLGRNGSGKTALLKGLHRFNPGNAEAYEPERDFPRSRYTSEFRDPADWPAVSCRFVIGEELRAVLAQIAAPEDAPRLVAATRYYDRSLKLDFDPPLAEDALSPRQLLEPLEALGDAAMSLAAPAADQEERYAAIRRDLLEWIAAARTALIHVESLRSPAGMALLARIGDEAMAKGRPETKEPLQAFLAALAGPLQTISRPSVVERLGQEIEARLPVFIYFDNAGVLDSSVYLPGFLADLERKPDDMAVRTINAMFKHAGLTAREIADLGHSQARAQHSAGEVATPEDIRKDQDRSTLRSIKLGSASADITRKFAAWWKQQGHVIRYHADGDFFRIWVADDRRPVVEIELERRSEGFRWFFSFYLVFLGESEAMEKDAVLLLDSPGLHLHPTAQQDLLALFRKLGERNQVIYGTHSPFLIDGDHLDRVRPITLDESGRFHVCIGDWPKDKEAIYPLQAAAGYAMMRGLFEHRKVVLVKEVSDYFYLSALSLLCRRSGRTALPEDVNLMPCGGTLMLAKIVALFLGQPTHPVILLDGDETSRIVRDKLVKDFYLGQDRHIVMLDDVLSKPGAGIEDLFGEIVILGALEKILGKSMLVLPADRIGASVMEHVGAAAKRLGFAMPEGWKAEMARQIAKDWTARDPRDVPAGILERAAGLFQTLIARFEEDASHRNAGNEAPITGANYAKAS